MCYIIHTAVFLFILIVSTVVLAVAEPALRDTFPGGALVLVWTTGQPGTVIPTTVKLAIHTGTETKRQSD